MGRVGCAVRSWRALSGFRLSGGAFGLRDPSLGDSEQGRVGGGLDTEHASRLQELLDSERDDRIVLDLQEVSVPASAPTAQLLLRASRDQAVDKPTILRPSSTRKSLDSPVVRAVRGGAGGKTGARGDGKRESPRTGVTSREGFCLSYALSLASGRSSVIPSVRHDGTTMRGPNSPVIRRASATRRGQPTNGLVLFADRP